MLSTFNHYKIRLSYFSFKSDTITIFISKIISYIWKYRFLDSHLYIQLKKRHKNSQLIRSYFYVYFLYQSI